MTDLECMKENLESRKWDIHMAVMDKFSYGRSPADCEYLEIIPLLDELKSIEFALKELEGM